MGKYRIPLFDLKLSPQAKREVNEVLRSGWLNTGPMAAALEKEIARLDRVRYAVAVSSATEGLQLALEALGIGSGYEVITTPFTFAATAASIIHTGATPVFADIELDTLSLDPDEIERKITPRTACVVPVDIAGHPADYERLAEICNRRKLPLIADAAHSLGATLRRRPTARWADVAIHSFQATKNLTTADGGMVVSKHKALIERVRLLSQHAMTVGAYQRKRSGGWEYDVVGLGHKANLSDIHAAIGLGQLSVFEKNQVKRAELAERYRQNLADLSDYIALPTVRKQCHHAWHLFIIRLHLSKVNISRAGFVRRMAEAGIECGVHYKPLFEMSIYKEFGYNEQHFPNAAYAGRRVVSLPLYPELKLSEVDYICGAIRKIVLG